RDRRRRRKARQLHAGRRLPRAPPRHRRLEQLRLSAGAAAPNVFLTAPQLLRGRLPRRAIECRPPADVTLLLGREELHRVADAGQVLLGYRESAPVPSAHWFTRLQVDGVDRLPLEIIELEVRLRVPLQDGY